MALMTEGVSSTALQRLFVAGTPATGKTMLGDWLSRNGYLHINAEKDDGIDFDSAGIHVAWNQLVRSGKPDSFADVLARIMQPVVITWGFPVEYLYVVKALQHVGIATWWIAGNPVHARAAYVRRYLAGHGPHPSNFDPQMEAIEREWFLIESVFQPRTLIGLNPDGSQRSPEELWAEMNRGG